MKNHMLVLCHFLFSQFYLNMLFFLRKRIQKIKKRLRNIETSNNEYFPQQLKLQLIVLAMLLFVLGVSAQTTYKGKKMNHESISSVFAVPGGYERNNIDAYSEWLIAHPLKEKSEVKYYNGNVKHNNFIYAAVFDYEIGSHGQTPLFNY